MTDEELRDMLMTMEPTPDGVGQTAATLLQAADDMRLGEVSGPSDFAARFCEEVTCVALDWMGSGQVDFIRKLLARLQELAADRGESAVLRALPVSDRLATQIAFIRHLLAVFLRRGNLAKYFGLLAGNRRAAWREAIQWIYDQDRPVSVSDVVNASLFRRVNTAGHALDEMSRIGLLVKRQEGTRSVVYELSWPGRGLSRALADTDSDQVGDLADATTAEIKKMRIAVPSGWASRKMEKEVRTSKNDTIRAFAEQAVSAARKMEPVLR